MAAVEDGGICGAADQVCLNKGSLKLARYDGLFIKLCHFLCLILHRQCMLGVLELACAFEPDTRQ